MALRGCSWICLHDGYFVDAFEISWGGGGVLHNNRQAAPQSACSHVAGAVAVAGVAARCMELPCLSVCLVLAVWACMSLTVGSGNNQ